MEITFAFTMLPPGEIASSRHDWINQANGGIR
jgi:hypothetical protein